MFIFPREPLETLNAPSESFEGSPKRSTFEILAESERDATSEVKLDSDEELDVSTEMEEPSNST